MAGEVALNIFSSKTFTPSPPYRVRGRLYPLPLPTGRQARGEGFIEMKDTKEKITKDKTHKAIIAKPKFQQVNEGDGE